MLVFHHGLFGWHYSGRRAMMEATYEGLHSLPPS
uniref:Uncharacterized protein n=1 Tax=Siphoviridae sp. ctio73 TaxID=2826435 RepID=A0A8S5MXG0_9CAUD|nr:MAG TPA: hypothetical protein [Siphoviridae sp. ctio73]